MVSVFYSEDNSLIYTHDIVFLEPEVYAAREKDGVYIPRERYLHDEAEKKVRRTQTHMHMHSFAAQPLNSLSFSGHDRENGT